MWRASRYIDNRNTVYITKTLQVNWHISMTSNPSQRSPWFYDAMKFTSLNFYNHLSVLHRHRSIKTNIYALLQKRGDLRNTKRSNALIKCRIFYLYFLCFIIPVMYCVFCCNSWSNKLSDFITICAHNS